MLNRKIIIVVLATVSIFIQSEVNASGNAIPSMNTSVVITDVLIGLVLVCTSIFVLGWLVKRFGGVSLMQNSNMKIVGSMSLGTKEKIILVDVAGKRLLLGVASGSISMLHDFSDCIDRNNDRCESDSTEYSEQSQIEEPWEFSKYLKKIINDGMQK